MGWIDVVLVCACLAAIGAWYIERLKEPVKWDKKKEDYLDTIAILEKQNVKNTLSMQEKIKRLEENIRLSDQIIDSKLRAQAHRYELKILSLKRKLSKSKARSARLLEQLRNKKGTKRAEKDIKKIDKELDARTFYGNEFDDLPDVINLDDYL